MTKARAKTSVRGMERSMEKKGNVPEPNVTVAPR